MKEQEKEKDEQVIDQHRRQLLKLSAGTIAGVGAVAGAGSWIKHRVEGVEQDGYPVEISPSFKRKDQRDVLLTFAGSKALGEKHPERNLSLSNDADGPAKSGEKSFNFQKGIYQFATAHTRADNNKVGYTQLDYALEQACWHGMNILAPLESMGVPNQGTFGWDQSEVKKEKYPFKDSVEILSAIKTAAKTFGAVRVGICKRDKRWDYDPLYDLTQEKTLTWEEDFPFEPKSVIVMLTDMDYDAMATAPMIPASATAAMGYTQNTIQGGGMAKFLRELGYMAVGSGNDLGSSVSYAIAAGLGEGARNGALIAPNLGPRVRISKVYTNLELDDAAYDKPRDFGILTFCENCKRCAESCPGKAISMDDKPSMSSTFAGNDDPDYNWQGQPGMRKFHNDAKKCFKFWCDNGGDCGACIASCPWNKPDFWHHRLIDASNTFTAGPVHTMMKQADILFGYGNTNDEKAVEKFWRSGFSGDFT